MLTFTFTTELSTLHRSPLIMKKLKRWTQINTSTFSRRIDKAHTDLEDIICLIDRMKEQGLTMNFYNYQAELLKRLNDVVKMTVEFVKGNKKSTNNLFKLLQIIIEEDQERLSQNNYRRRSKAA